jgi:hypothetical protein
MDIFKNVGVVIQFGLKSWSGYKMPKLTVKDLSDSKIATDLFPEPNIPELQRDAITIDLQNIIAERDRYIKTLEAKLKQPKTIDIDEDAFLLYVKSLNPADHPSVASVIKQQQQYQKKSHLLDVIKLVKMFMSVKN